MLFVHHQKYICTVGQMIKVIAGHLLHHQAPIEIVINYIDIFRKKMRGVESINHTIRIIDNNFNC